MHLLSSILLSYSKELSLPAKKIISIYAGLFLFYSTGLFAQLQVSKEPMHRPVIVNEYIRLLDVRIEPGDTTKFHVHSTPSLFVHLSNTNISTQIKSEAWIPEKSVAGKTWYKSLTPDILFHRVCNTDTIPLHVIDIELLSAYDKKQVIPDNPLPYPLFLQSEKAWAYRLDQALVNGLNLMGRGPMIAVLLSGGQVAIENLVTGQTSEITSGQFSYLDPGASFHFTCKDKGEMNMVLFEIK